MLLRFCTSPQPWQDLISPSQVFGLESGFRAQGLGFKVKGLGFRRLEDLRWSRVFPRSRD